MQVKFLLFAALCFLTVAACKHDHDEDDTTPPTLTIDEPLENDSVSGEAHIEGDVTDESLHNMEIRITQDSDGAELYKVSPEVHDKTAYHFHQHWAPTLSAAKAVTVTITVEDHQENKTVKSVKFTINP